MNYSPLRYPGGKAKFTPYIKSIIDQCPGKIETYIEPFVGGGGVALELLLSKKVKTIVINDYDKAIYSFWRAVVEDTPKLLRLISNTEVNIEEWYRQKEIYKTYSNKYSVQLAFATFFLNRTNRSGILNAGPIGGYKQQGEYLINARYNKNKLIKRIENIAKQKKHIQVYNKEIRKFIVQILSRYEEGAFAFFDPPYIQKGNRLYKNCLSLEDHKVIAEYIKSKVFCEWVITYDNTEDIKKIYTDEYYKIYEWTYSVVKSNRKKEIIIFKNKNICPNDKILLESDIKINFL